MNPHARSKHFHKLQFQPTPHNSHNIPVIVKGGNDPSLAWVAAPHTSDCYGWLAPILVTSNELATRHHQPPMTPSSPAVLFREHIALHCHIIYVSHIARSTLRSNSKKLTTPSIKAWSSGHKLEVFQVQGPFQIPFQNSFCCNSKVKCSSCPAIFAQEDPGVQVSLATRPHPRLIPPWDLRLATYTTSRWL